MKKKYVFCSILFVLLFLAFCYPKAYGADIDEIENYIVTVEPNKKDASLDIYYEITWKVLDSTRYGPLTWAKIGTPNGNFSKPKALSSNIKKISKLIDRSWGGSYVAIDFKRAYEAGESVTFKYSIHQPYMCTVTEDICQFKFTPAWFSYAKVDNLTVRWNADAVQESDNHSQEDGYLIWTKKDMERNERLTANITYPKDAFAKIKTTGVKGKDWKKSLTAFIIVSLIIVIIVVIIHCKTGRICLLCTQWILWRRISQTWLRLCVCLCRFKRRWLLWWWRRRRLCLCWKW